MKLRLTPEQKQKWDKIAANLKRANDLLGECELILKLELNIQEGLPVEKIDQMQKALSGQAYMFTPQSEWVGGDNFVYNSPHVNN